VVLVTDDWVAFKREASLYIERARVFYKVDKYRDAAIVKIAVGRVAFEREFDLSKEEDRALLEEIMRWLEEQEGFPVKRAVPDDLFFAEVRI